MPSEEFVKGCDRGRSDSALNHMTSGPSAHPNPGPTSARFGIGFKVGERQGGFQNPS